MNCAHPGLSKVKQVQRLACLVLKAHIHLISVEQIVRHVQTTCQSHWKKALHPLVIAQRLLDFLRFQNLLVSNALSGRTVQLVVHWFTYQYFQVSGDLMLIPHWFTNVSRIAIVSDIIQPLRPLLVDDFYRIMSCYYKYLIEQSISRIVIVSRTILECFVKVAFLDMLKEEQICYVKNVIKQTFQ